MKLPSLQHLTAEAGRVVRRFPLTLLCSLLLGAVGIYYQRLDFQYEQPLQWLFPLLSAAGLGLPLTLSVALAAERYQWPGWGRALAAAGTVALLVLWYVLCPADPTLVWGLRLVLLLLGLHLLVAVVPYLPELRRQADTLGFWRYNEILFLRILTAGLYSGVLFVGCALALLAIETLFDVKLYQHLYQHLFTVLATGFNTWFFLAGVPHDWVALEQQATYPKGLKLFTQFVLLPLVVLYLVILYAYLARILVLQTLPNGWVSTLILAFSVAGIFALLLIHSIRNATENTWIRTFARWFYRALFPLLALLFVAIGTRVLQYGITEQRYFVLVLAAWLVGIAAYFLRRQGQGIIWIPASLALVAFLAAGGPWGAFAVAERSQLNRLREINVQYKLLKEGKLDGAGTRVPNLPATARKQLTSIFDFFTDRNALKQLQPLFAGALIPPDSLQGENQLRVKQWQADRLVSLSGVTSYGTDGVSAAEDYRGSITFYPKDTEVRSLGGGSYWVEQISSDMAERGGSMSFAVQEGTFRLRISESGAQIMLEQKQADGHWQRQLTASPGQLADSLARQPGGELSSDQHVPAQNLTLRVSNGRHTLQLYLLRLTCDMNDERSYAFEANAFLSIAASARQQ